jgi:ribonuclease P protein component
MTAGDLDSDQLGRIVRPADYVRVLATPMRLRSPHFAVHHLEGRPLPVKPAGRAAKSDAPDTASLSTELSTGAVPTQGVDVEDCGGAASRTDESTAPLPRGPGRWLGLVVPKKHAKRAVTRTLVKRQIRNVAAQCAAQLEPGLWVVRQRSPFDPKQYPSAASDALKEAARAELRALFERAVRGERDRLKPREPKGKPAGAAPAVREEPPCAA